MRCASFTALGLGDELLRAGIENAESCFFNRFGQLIYREPRGKAAGYQYPEVGIHRGKLHLALYRAVRERIGELRRTNHLCAGVEQDESRRAPVVPGDDIGARAAAGRGATS